MRHHALAALVVLVASPAWPDESESEAIARVFAEAQEHVEIAARVARVAEEARALAKTLGNTSTARVATRTSVDSFARMDRSRKAARRKLLELGVRLLRTGDLGGSQRVDAMRRHLDQIDPDIKRPPSAPLMGLLRMIDQMRSRREASIAQAGRPAPRRARLTVGRVEVTQLP